MSTERDQRTTFNAVVVGWYGAPNIGDELLLEVLKRAVEDRGGEVAVVSVDPNLTKQMHGVNAIDFNNLGEVARALLWADVLIMGGGGIFQDHHPFTLSGLYDPCLNDISSYARPVHMARQFELPVLIWGHGVGPLRGAEAQQIVRDVFDRSDFISVRDEASLKILKKIGVDRAISVGADPGWLYRKFFIGNERRIGSTSKKKKILAIVVREWGDGASWKRKVQSAIEAVVDNDWQVAWIAFQANIQSSGALSDLSVIDEIRERLPEGKRGYVVAPKTVRQAWDNLADADAVFSMRLHASVLALSAQRPVIGLEYDDKMSEAHAMAGMPADARLHLNDPQERYIEALKRVMGKFETPPWIIDDCSLTRLEQSALVHVDLLGSFQIPTKKYWVGGQFDWIGAWLQQALNDLRSMREANRLAYEILEFRDHTIGELNAELITLRSSVSKLESAESRISEKIKKKYESILKCSGHESRDAIELPIKLDAIFSELQTRLDESKVRIGHQEMYIADKEIYISQLRNRIEDVECELRDARDRRFRVRQFMLAMRNKIQKTVLMPAKFILAWRKHGVKFALRRSLQILRGGGEPLGLEPMQSGYADLTIVPRPVRTEQFIVICNSSASPGLLRRPIALMKAAMRAGFLVRWVDTAKEGATNRMRDMGRLNVDEKGFNQLIEKGNCRVLVADASSLGSVLARRANKIGAEVILDLSAIDADALTCDAFNEVASCASRAVSREGGMNSRCPDLPVEVLPDAADNEEFDSYRSYGYPAEFDKSQRNILVSLNGVGAQRVLSELVAIRPSDCFHVLVNENQDYVGGLHWDVSRQASMLAAADAILVLNQNLPVDDSVRELIYSALIMERPVIMDAVINDVESKNLHRLDGRHPSALLDDLTAVEDYEFVSKNSWLARSEQLIRADFPTSISVIVLIYNNKKIIERCVRTMLDHCGKWIREIVVVDNQSTDGGGELVEMLFEHEAKVKLVRNIENGCSSGRNLGVRHSSGEFLAFFDSDQWLTSPSCFAEAVAILEAEPSIGAIGWNAGWFDATRSDLGGVISDYVFRRGMNDAAMLRGYREDIGFLGTSGMFMRRDLFQKIDGFDTFYDPTCFEDTDICFQIKKAGYSVVLRDLAGVRHQPHQTTGASEGSERYMKQFNRNADYFRKKWQDHPEFFVDYSEKFL